MARADCRPGLLVLAMGLTASAPAQQPAPPVATANGEPQARQPAARAGGAPVDSTGRVSVWVDLELPELTSLPPDRRADREALGMKIHAQQDEVMARLRELGATEQARVRQVRNALAVRLPGAQLEAARRIPGVRSVRPVLHVHRGPLVQGD